MNITILPGRKTIKAALDYSEDKVAKGVASVEDCVNMPDTDMFTIYSTLERFTDNDEVDPRTRNFVFHFAVSPGPEDINCFRDDAVAFIKEMMAERLGYAEIPYVIYRHNDIPREHFHIVAPSMDASGRNIEMTQRQLNGGERRITTMLRAVRELGDRYGFTLGKGDAGEWLDPEEAKEVKEVKTSRQGLALRADNSDTQDASVGVVSEIRKTCTSLMEYDFLSLMQLQILLLDRGIKAYRSRKTGLFLFQRLPGPGHPPMKPLSEKVLFPDGSFSAMIEERVTTAKKKTNGDDRLRSIASACLSMTTRVPDFAQALRDCGLRVVTVGPAPFELRNIYVVDMSSRTVRGCSSLVGRDHGLTPGQRASRVPFLDKDSVNAILAAADGRKKAREQDAGVETKQKLFV